MKKEKIVEKTRFNIIISFYKNQDTIDKLLMSIGDQDYKNFDVTIVIDGLDIPENKLADNYITKKYYKDGEYKTKYSLSLERMLTNSGASAARNFGAQMSGENIKNRNKRTVLFFIDADCILNPGMLREIATQFESDETIDFVYGNYQIRDEKEIRNFNAQDYDPKLLETMNYISTMSPIRREIFYIIGGFDEKLDYFQDWSLFYNAASHGFVGKYLKEYIFETKATNEESISASHGMTLSQKAKKFRDYHGIKDKEIVVTTHGAVHQAQQRAKILNADYVGPAKGSARAIFPVNYQFENWELTYFVGCYNLPIEALQNHMNVIYGRPIYHFIGTDIWQMYSVHSTRELKEIKKEMEQQKAVILANSPRGLQELKDCGFDNAELVYTPLYDINQYRNIKPLPKKFTVAVYYSDSNNMLRLEPCNYQSNMPLILDVANAMPDIEFKFFGGKEKIKVGNVEYCGRIPEDEMVSFINDCSMLVRSTIHDGFPQTPIQFMLCGRQALVSCPDKEMRFSEKLSFEEWYAKEDIDYEQAKSEIINKIYNMDKKVISKTRLKMIQFYYKWLMSERRFKRKIRGYMND